jgi:hypothetical protein
MVFREKYPALWDEKIETFSGLVSTNAIEGSNWRLKYGTPNAVHAVPNVRTALLALHAMYDLFRNRRPQVSFTQ